MYLPQDHPFCLYYNSFGRCPRHPILFLLDGFFLKLEYEAAFSLQAWRWKIDLHETGCHPTLCWRFLFKEHNIHSWAGLKHSYILVCWFFFFNYLWTNIIVGNARWKPWVLSSSVMKGRECQPSIILGGTLPLQPRFEGRKQSFIIITENVNWAFSVIQMLWKTFHMLFLI